MAMADSVHVDVAKIIVTPNERSIHFNKRECTLTEAQKVGRSVDKKRILPSNLIFDCRVLSRNHALIWFENGKFFIKDTKSSNGTFVNEVRLSASGEESPARELRSKDVVQFGVNVNVDKKAHGCIIARVRLFVNDAELPGVEPPVQQVLQIIQNSLAREQELETRLVSMQTAIEGARQLATESMLAIVKEDELLSRLEMLENQLQVYAKNSSEDELKKQLAKAYEEKHHNDLTSKNSLRNMLQEKLDQVSKASQLQRDYDKAEQECQKYRTLYDVAKQEHTLDVAKLTEQLKSAQEETKSCQEKLSEEKGALVADLDHLKGDIQYKEEQLLKAKQRLEETEVELVGLKIAMETNKQRKTLLVQNSELQQVNESPSVVQVFPTQEAAPTHNGDGSGEGETPIAEGSPLLPTDKQLLRRETLLSPDIIVKQLELKQRDWEAKVKGLERELQESESTVRNLQTQLAGYLKTEASHKQAAFHELAKRLTASAISKGQLKLLGCTLAEAQQRSQSLQDQLLSDSSSRLALEEKVQEVEGKLYERQHLLEAKEKEISSLTGDMKERNRTAVALPSDQTALKEEAARLKEKYTKQLTETVTVKQKNTELVREVEGLRQQLCESDKKSEDDTAATGQLQKVGHYRPLQFIEDDDERVKLLTIIALVSIGVALASWLT